MEVAAAAVVTDDCGGGRIVGADFPDVDFAVEGSSSEASAEWIVCLICKIPWTNIWQTIKAPRTSYPILCSLSPTFFVKM